MFLLDYIYSTHPHHKFWIKDVPILPSPQSHIPRSAPPLIFPVSCFLSSSPQLTCPRHSSRGQSVFLCSYLSSNYHCLSLLNFALKKKATPSLFLIYLQPTALSPPYVLVAKPNICFSVWICCHLCGLWDGYSTLSQGGSFLPLLPHFLLRFSSCLIWPLFLWFFSKSSAPCRALRCWILKGLSSRYAFAWALLSNLWALVTSRVERPASLLQLNCPCRWATMPPSRAHQPVPLPGSLSWNLRHQPLGPTPDSSLTYFSLSSPTLPLLLLFCYLAVPLFSFPAHHGDLPILFLLPVMLYQLIHHTVPKVTLSENSTDHSTDPSLQKLQELPPTIIQVPQCVCVCSKPSKVSWLLSTSLILPPTPSLENPTIQSEDFHSSTVCAV